jgi:hypothetical protein
MSPSTLARDPADEAEYRSAIVDVLAFAVEKLNDKAVYANTLVFSGRVFGMSLTYQVRARVTSDLPYFQP